MSHPRPANRIVTALLPLCLLVGLLLAGPLAQSASAAPAPVAVGTLPVGRGTTKAAPFICSATPSVAQTASNDLPINRWSGAASQLHADLSGGFFGLSDLQATIERSGLEQGALSVGNTLWRAGTGLVAESTAFCIGDTIGLQINKITAAVGNAVFHSGLVAALIVVAVLMALWAAARGKPQPWRRLVAPVFCLGLLIAMIAGSTDFTNNNGQLQFGTMSPAWMVSKAFSVVGAVTSLPAAAFNRATAGVAPSNSATTGTADPFACAGYENAMIQKYDAAFPGRAYGAALPVSLDSMWESTGLGVYSDTQFGTDNKYGTAAYCHLLELDSGVSPASQIKVIKTAAATAGGGFVALADRANPRALAFRDADTESTDAIYRSMVGWAACRPTSSGTWAVAGGWASIRDPNSDSTISPSLCSQWWSGTSTLSGTALGWGGGLSATSIGNATSGHPNVQSFLLTFVGANDSSGVAASVLYVIASLVVFGVFAALSLAVIIAKLALLVLAMLAVVVVLLGIIPGSDTTSRGIKLAKHALGFVVFASCAQLVVSLVALISAVVISVGVAGGAFVGLLFTCFAPLAAVVVLHLLFTKILKGPSPFTPSGSFQLASAASGLALGAGVGAALDRHVSPSGAWRHGQDALSWARVRNPGGAPPAPRPGGLDPGNSRSSDLAARRRDQPPGPAPTPPPGPGPAPGPAGEDGPGPFDAPPAPGPAPAPGPGPTHNPPPAPGPGPAPTHTPPTPGPGPAPTHTPPTPGPTPTPTPGPAPTPTPTPGPGPSRVEPPSRPGPSTPPAGAGPGGAPAPSFDTGAPRPPASSVHEPRPAPPAPEPPRPAPMPGPGTAPPAEPRPAPQPAPPPAAPPPPWASTPAPPPVPQMPPRPGPVREDARSATRPASPLLRTPPPTPPPAPAPPSAPAARPTAVPVGARPGAREAASAIPADAARWAAAQRRSRPVGQARQVLPSTVAAAQRRATHPATPPRPTPAAPTRPSVVQPPPRPGPNAPAPRIPASTQPHEGEPK